MQITVQCPLCGTAAQLDDSLMGRKLRCANPDCRKTFRVTPQGEALPAADKAGEARTVEAAPDWQSAPPPIAGSAAVGQEGDWTAVAPPPRQGEWSPPPGYSPEGEAPVFAAEGEEGQVYAAEGETEEGAYEAGYEYGDYTHYRKPSHKMRNIVLGLIFLSIVGIAGMVVVFFTHERSSKELMEKAALESFNKGEFYQAKEQFDALKQKFPAGAEKYDFYIELCAVANTGAEAKRTRQSAKFLEAGEGLKTFVDKWSPKPDTRELYADRHGEIWRVASDLTLDCYQIARGQENADPDPAFLTKGDELHKIADSHEDKPKPEEVIAFKKRAAELKESARLFVKIFQDRKAFMAKVQDVAKRRDPTLVDEQYEILRALNLDWEGIRNDQKYMADKELKAKLDGLFQDLDKEMNKLRGQESSWVRYIAPKTESQAQTPNAAEEGVSLVAGPPLKVPGTQNGKDGPIVLALARGTLYGLSATDGEPRWALRIGIDTLHLPPRLPIRPDRPDYAYVVAQDVQGTFSLNCIDVKTGAVKWQRPLPVSCPAGPTLIGDLLYVPLRNGRLEMIDANSGDLKGTFEFRQRLTVPPVWDKASNRLFVPAEQNRIFVMQLGQQPTCTEVMHTKHRAGSIRGGLIVSQEHLVFAEAIRADTMVVRAYPLKGGEPVNLPRIPGLSAYMPRFDDDTIAFLSDKGYFSLVAVNRGISEDERPLSALTPMALSVDRPEGTDPDSVPSIGPAQIVDVQLNDWALLVGPWLHRKRFDPYRKKLAAGDSAPLLLGTPLHAPSLSPDSRYVIVVSLLGSRVQATAINRVTGAVVWQRQLGMQIAQEPVRLGDQVLILDQSGAMARFDAKTQPEKGSSWLPLTDWPSLPTDQLRSRLVVSPNGKLAISYAYNPTKQQLLLRQVSAAGGPAREQVIALASPPWGTAALSDEGTLMMPCRDGNLHEFNIERSSTVVRLNWRSATARIGSRGHALFLSPKQLIATDGQRRLLRWDKGADNSWRQVDAIEVALAKDFSTPLLAVRVKAAGGEDAALVAAGDEAGTVHLVPVLGGVSPQTFADGGTIAQGPVLLGPRRLGWVKEIKPQAGQGGSSQFSLVMWELGKSEPVRYQSAQSNKQIIGVPQPVGDMVLIAEQGETAGQVTWLLPNGSTLEVPFTRNLTPTAGGFPLDGKRVLVPLSDGTIRFVDIPNQ